MKPVLFSGKARNDISAIYKYTESIWSLRQAAEYRNLILDECFSIPQRETILSFPTYKDYLYTHCGHHYIFFKSSESEIKIVRILHESMSFAKQL